MKGLQNIGTLKTPEGELDVYLSENGYIKVVKNRNTMLNTMRKAKTCREAQDIVLEIANKLKWPFVMVI